MSHAEKIGVGLLGAGVVGGAFLDQYSKNPKLRQVIDLKKVLVRDLSKERPGNLPSDIFTTDAYSILTDPKIQIIISVLGQEMAESAYIKRALEEGKTVVTGSKENISKNIQHLSGLAQDHSVAIFYEASVAGAIPIVGALRETLSTNTFVSVEGIVNGTTNYILTRMSEGIPYEIALAEAQREGYAEPDPTNDVMGNDSAYKIAILSTLAFKTYVDPTDVHKQGITELEQADFTYAQRLGYVIKLIASGRLVNNELEVWVGPTMVPKDHALASVNGATNGIFLQGEPIKGLKLEGEGAGAEPTVASINSDLNKALFHLRQGTLPPAPVLDSGLQIRPFEKSHGHYAVRMRVLDVPGTLHAITGITTKYSVNIDEVLQEESSKFQNGHAEMMLTLNPTERGALEKALEEIRALEGCFSIGPVLHVLPK